MNAPASTLDRTLTSGPLDPASGYQADRQTLLEGWAQALDAPSVPPQQAPHSLAARVNWYHESKNASQPVVDPPPRLSQQMLRDATRRFVVAENEVRLVGVDDVEGLDRMLVHLDRAFAGVGLETIQLHVLRDDELLRLEEAVALLGAVLPDLARGTLAFVSCIVCIENEIPSTHLSSTPEIIYIGHRVVAEWPVWQVAESILHECLHDRSWVARQTRWVLSADYDEEQSATTTLPWSLEQPTVRHFSTWRLLSAAHVYTMVSGLRVACDVDPQDTLYRGRFMLEALLEPKHERALGPDGIQLRDWLLSTIGNIEEAA